MGRRACRREVLMSRWLPVGYAIDGCASQAGDRMTFTLMPDGLVLMRVKNKSVMTLAGSQHRKGWMQSNWSSRMSPPSRRPCHLEGFGC
jgi:hypothetical protein